MTSEALEQAIIEILTDMTEDWDTGMDDPIRAETRLVADLQFESIDVVQFIVAIEERLRRRGFPFEQLLMKDGKYVDEIRVSDAAAFLHRQYPAQG